MNKTEFLQELYNHLLPLSAEERSEIIADFEDHFRAGLERGKTEEQICAELGNPYTCALQFLRTSDTQQTPPPPPPQYNAPPAAPPVPPYGSRTPQSVNDRRNKTLWGILFFIVLFCAIGVYPASIALMLCPIAILIAAIVAVAFAPTGLMVGLMISLSVFLFSLGLFGFLLTTWLLKLSYRRAGF